MTGPPPRATPRLEGRTRNGLAALRAPAPATVPGLKNAPQADLGFCPGTGAQYLRCQTPGGNWPLGPFWGSIAPEARLGWCPGTGALLEPPTGESLFRLPDDWGKLTSLKGLHFPYV